MLPGGAGPDGVDDSFLDFQHDLVDSALLLIEAVAGRHSALDVGRVVVELGTGVEMDQDALPDAGVPLPR